MKVGRIRNHLGTRLRAARMTISAVSPPPTDGGVDDHRVIVEIGSNVARCRTPMTCWLTPIRRRGPLVGDILGDVCTGKVPD